MRGQPASALAPGIFRLSLQPLGPFTLLPSFYIQIAPVAGISPGALIMLDGYRVQVPEGLQSWYIGQGLDHIHVPLEHIPQCHHFFFRRFYTAQGRLNELFTSLSVHEHQAIEDTPRLDHSFHIGIKFFKGGRQFLAPR